MKDFTKINTTQAPAPQSAAGYDAGLREYVLKVYNFMVMALGISGVIAYVAGNSAAYQQFLMANQGVYWVIAIAPLALVFLLGFRINKMSFESSKMLYIAYSALMGLSLATLFMVYTQGSIAKVFFITAGTFGAMSLYGYTTKRDLTGMGSFLLMGLIGIIIASVVNMFIGSSVLELAVSVIAIFIFIGLTAYDTQKIKHNYYALGGTSEIANKAALMSALNLYLDFVNLLVYMLRFFGDRK